MEGMTRRGFLKAAAIGAGAVALAPLLPREGLAAGGVTFGTFEEAPLFGPEKMACRPVLGADTKLSSVGGAVRSTSWYGKSIPSWWIKKSGQGVRISRCGRDVEGDEIDLVVTARSVKHVYRSGYVDYSLMIDVCDAKGYGYPAEGGPICLDVVFFNGASLKLEMKWAKTGTSTPAAVSAYCTAYDVDVAGGTKPYAESLPHKGAETVGFSPAAPCDAYLSAETILSRSASTGEAWYPGKTGGGATTAFDASTAAICSVEGSSLAVALSGAGGAKEADSASCCATMIGWRAPAEYVAAPGKEGKVIADDGR